MVTCFISELWYNILQLFHEELLMESRGNIVRRDNRLECSTLKSSSHSNNSPFLGWSSRYPRVVASETVIKHRVIENDERGGSVKKPREK